ncbi:hypothetical protein BD413DRAFT_227726 [Trametes elegans]|nr:hypothetical protein BD413DRAFT_227726 [Trametes elegans]
MDDLHATGPEPKDPGIIAVCNSSSSTSQVAAAARLCEVHDIVRAIFEEGLNSICLRRTNPTIAEIFTTAPLFVAPSTRPQYQSSGADRGRHLLAPPYLPRSVQLSDVQEQRHYANVMKIAKIYDDPAVWRSFLRNAAYVREIVDVHWATTASSLCSHLIPLILEKHKGKTIPRRCGDSIGMLPAF